MTKNQEIFKLDNDEFKLKGGRGFYDGEGEIMISFFDEYENGEILNSWSIFNDIDEAAIFYNELKSDKTMWQYSPKEIVCSHDYLKNQKP